MQVFIKTLNNLVFPIDVSSYDTIFQVKSKIANQYNFPINNQFLIFCGQEMKNNDRISDYNIEGITTFHLLIR